MARRRGQKRGERGDRDHGPGMAGTKQSRLGKRYAHWPSLKLSWPGCPAETGICA
jgi:hypothetical protein